MIRGITNGHSYSATRFAWPITLPSGFGSMPQVAEGGADWRRCREADWLSVEQQARKRYFTEETRQVIFGQDNWWILDVEQQEFKVPMPGGRVVEALMPPPALVAFEADSRFSILRSGFLLIEVRMKGEWSFEDLLLFNELFRYTREPWEGHSQLFEAQLKSFLLPINTMLGVNGGDAYEARWQALMPRPKDGLKELNPIWSYADDRAFTWTRVITKDPSALVYPANTPDSRHAGWIKLLNIDRPWIDNNAYDEQKTWAVSRFELEWAIPRTYRRWEHAGTFYGFTDFSGAMLTNEDSFAWKHWSQMYFDTALLLLYLRLTLFRFSAELARFTKQMSSSRKMEKWRNDFAELRKAFTVLENLYQFPLLSTQQQSLEMYECMRRAISVQELYQEVSQEVSGSNVLLENLVEQQRSALAVALNWLAVVGLGVSTGLGLADIKGLSEWLLSLVRHPSWMGSEFAERVCVVMICVVVSTFAFGLLAVGIFRWIKLKESRKASCRITC